MFTFSGKFELVKIVNRVSGLYESVIGGSTVESVVWPIMTLVSLLTLQQMITYCCFAGRCTAITGSKSLFQRPSNSPP